MKTTPIPFLTETYDYPSLEQINSPVGRRYACPDGHKVPSVTTILDKTTDKTYLELWRKRIGDAEADRQSQEARDVGELMHLHVEEYLAGNERPYDDGTYQRRLARKLADNIINIGFEHVEEIWAIEQRLYFPGLYAGTADLIGVYKGAPAIMDHKNAKKMKKEKDIANYFKQGAAYAIAHNHLFGTDIQQIVIFMASRDMDYKTFHIRPEAMGKWKDEWIRTCEDYYQNHHEG